MIVAPRLGSVVVALVVAPVVPRAREPAEVDCESRSWSTLVDFSQGPAALAVAAPIGPARKPD